MPTRFGRANRTPCVGFNPSHGVRFAIVEAAQRVVSVRAVAAVGAVRHRVVARGRFAPVVPARAAVIVVAGAAVAGIIAAGTPVIVASAGVVISLGETRAVVLTIIAVAILAAVV